MVQALGKALAQSAPYTKVIADETTADVILADEAPQWLSVPGTAQYVAAIAHHTYDYPTDKLRALLPPIAAKFHKPTWMTEICCYKGSGGVATSFGCELRPDDDAGFLDGRSDRERSHRGRRQRVVLVDGVVAGARLRSEGATRSVRSR